MSFIFASRAHEENKSIKPSHCGRLAVWESPHFRRVKQPFSFQEPVGSWLPGFSPGFSALSSLCLKSLGYIPARFATYSSICTGVRVKRAMQSVGFSDPNHLVLSSRSAVPWYLYIKYGFPQMMFFLKIIPKVFHNYFTIWPRTVVIRRNIYTLCKYDFEQEKLI